MTCSDDYRAERGRGSGVEEKHGEEEFTITDGPDIKTGIGIEKKGEFKQQETGTKTEVKQEEVKK